MLVVDQLNFTRLNPGPRRPSMNRRHFLGALALLFPSLRLRAQSKNSAEPQFDKSLADAANNFLSALRPELRRKFEFTFDDPYRKDWSNLPHYIHPRKGLRMGELNPAERMAAHRLMQ